jgi:hypothetical protein
MSASQLLMVRIAALGTPVDVAEVPQTLQELQITSMSDKR